jgi:hypothetical protein
LSENSYNPLGTYVFVVRLWEEDLGQGQSELRGYAQHINTGNSLYFRDLQTMNQFFIQVMSKNPPGGPT